MKQNRIKEKEAENFLKTYGLHESCTDFDAQLRAFSAEMASGLNGAESTLRMLPTGLKLCPEAALSGDVIAIDAGGTKLRASLVRFASGRRPAVIWQESCRLPGSECMVEKDVFFDGIAAIACSHTEWTDRIGLCFSFPCEINAARDGRLLALSKEIRVKGVSGVLVGAELNAALLRTGRPPVKVSVLNDTAAALLGTVFTQGVRETGGYVGLVYGTGANLCYYEKSKGILINTEAGGYGGFPQTRLDRELDLESENPGEQRFEKMISGAYFPGLALKALRLAAREGLFSVRTCEKIDETGSLDMIEIDAFLRHQDVPGAAFFTRCAAEGDAALLHGILDGLYERAAKLLAICVRASLLRGGGLLNVPALIAAEGSMFRKGYRFRERFERWLFIPDAGTGHIPFRLCVAEESSVVIGAAAAAVL